MKQEEVLKKITKIKPFINRCKLEEINFLSEKDNSKKIEKKIQQLLLMLKKKKMYARYA